MALEEHQPRHTPGELIQMTDSLQYRGTLVGHKNWVTSIAATYEQSNVIVSASRDKKVMVWELTPEAENCGYARKALCGHGEAVQDITLSSDGPFALSGAWDKLVKVWNLSNCKLRTNLAGHTGVVYTTSISPDGSLCASGGKDGIAMLWDVNDGKHLYSLDAGGTINALAFSPKNYWLVAATDTSIKIWDLENKNILDELQSSAPPKNGIPWCVSLSWSADGNILFAGSTDGNVYVYGIGHAS